MAWRTQQGKRFNDAMAHVRVSVENAFADVLNKWGFVGHRHMQVHGSMQVAKHMHVAFFLHNCFGILYGNMVSRTFGQERGIGFHSITGGT
eukprot:1751967-Rhodomonas_salina.2